MKRLFTALILTFPALGFAQGIINDGAVMKLDGGINIIVDGTAANAHYTLKGANGELKSGNASDKIILDGDFILDDAATIDTYTGTIEVSGGEWTNNGTGTGFVTNHGTVDMKGTNITFGGTGTTSAFNNLTFSNSGTVTMNTNLTVCGGNSGSLGTGTFNMGNKDFALNDKTLTINSKSTSAVTAGTGSWVSEGETGDPATNNSKVQWNISDGTGSYVFPFAISVGADDIPFTFNVTSAGHADSEITIATRHASGGGDNTPYSNHGGTPVTHMNSDHGGGASKTMDRWWDIDISSSSNPTVDMTFSYWGDSDNNTTDNPTAYYKAQRWDGTEWNEPSAGGGTGTSANSVGTVTATGVTQFSSWVLSQATAPLPIEMLEFTAECTNDQPEIVWSTASETNNDFFSIERSEDGESYEEIGRVPGAGTTSEQQDYSFIDEEPIGEAYYRIRQTDYDGKSEVFKAVTTDCSINFADASIAVFPNPAIGNTIRIEFAGLQSEKEVLVVLRDMMGKEVYSKVIVTDVSGGAYEVVDLEEKLAKGVYTVIGSSNNKMYSKKLVVH